MSTKTYKSHKKHKVGDIVTVHWSVVKRPDEQAKLLYWSRAWHEWGVELVRDPDMRFCVSEDMIVEALQ